VAGCVGSQNAPTRFARIFRVCHISAIKLRAFHPPGYCARTSFPAAILLRSGRDPRRQPTTANCLDTFPYTHPRPPNQPLTHSTFVTSPTPLPYIALRAMKP
jgi:hypothetical protein